MEYAQASTLGQAGASAMNQPKALESEHILQRLSVLQGALREINSSVDSAADKIVGQQPTPITGNGQTDPARPPASGFLDAIVQQLNALERTADDLRSNAQRFHRCF